MVTAHLTAWEREQLAQFVGHPDHRGDFEALVLALKVFKVLELTDVEKEEIGWTDEPVFVECPRCRERIETSDTGGRWEDVEREFPLEFEDAHFALLKGAVTFKGWAQKAARLLVPMLTKIKNAA